MNIVPNYWLQDIHGEIHHFYAANDDEARWYFMMSGDRAYDFGPIESLHVKIEEKKDD